MKISPDEQEKIRVFVESLYDYVSLIISYDPTVKLSLGAGGDETVKVNLISRDPVEGYFQSHQPGGVLIDVTTKYDEKGHGVASQRQFIPYNQIVSIIENERSLK